MVVEELTHADRVVLLVRRTRDTVILADVLEHRDFLAEPAQDVVVLEALVERHGAVLVVVQEQQRCLYLRRMEDRRVPDVCLGVVPVAAEEAALTRLEDRAVGGTAVPVY